MADGRAKNGNKGHSTKAKGIDKRKNPYRNAIRDAISETDVKDVLKALLEKAVKKGDTKAGQIVLEYTVGKPKDSLELSGELSGGINFNELISSYKSGKDK